RYLANWLAIRPAWIARVTSDPATVPPTPNDWRLFLNSVPADSLPLLPSQKQTASAVNKRETLQRFSAALPTDITGSTWAGNDTIKFRDQTPRVFSAFPIIITQGILWELSELSFRYDLLALDHHLVPERWRDAPAEREELWRAVFPSEIIGDMWDAPLPTSNAGVFQGGNLRDMDYIRYLNAFTRLVSAWPGAQPHYKIPLTASFGDSTLWNASAELILFYIKTFFTYTGRAPVVPRRVPGSARS
ncbi:hypothetical protein HYDPIDRAFT_33928, partial [Hydnomerulius pinastri MD-312]